MIRPLGVEERVSILKSLLKAKEREQKALKEEIKALNAQTPIAFNWMRYKKNMGRNTKGDGQ